MVSLLVTMIAVGSAFLMNVRIRLVQYYRYHQDKSRGTQRICEPSPGKMRFLVFIVGAVAIGAVVLGYKVIERYKEVRDQIQQPHCGKSGKSHVLEHNHRELAAFQKLCRANQEFAKRPVSECPNFVQKFPPPAPYVTYLAIMELKDTCTGFCSKATPLFTSDPVAAATPCSSIVLGQLRRMTHLVAGAGIICGTILAIEAFLFATYDEL